MSKALIVICTRKESSRLPEKVFKKIVGRPAIEHILKRVEATGLDVMLAMPDGEMKDFMFLREKFPRIWFFEGHPASPLHRMLEAAKFYNEQSEVIDYVVRITHDDILIDAKEVMSLLKAAREHGAGYVISDGIVEGAGVEVISVDNIAYAATHNEKPVEHISYFVHGPQMPKPLTMRVKCRPEIERPYRLTMDYPEDAFVLETVLRYLGPDATVDKICEFLDVNSHILRYNALPLVTVYTCAYNAVAYVAQTMRSVLSKMAPWLEYVIVEDCSTDSTLLEIVNTIANEDRSRVKLIVNEENMGLASSSNIALSAARGKYVMRLDADDVLFTGALESMLEIIQKEKYAVLYPGHSIIDQHGVMTEGFIDGAQNHHAGGALMDKRMLNEIRFTNGLRHWDSADLFKRMKEKHMPVGYWPLRAFMYRRHSANMSTPSAERHAGLEDMRRIFGEATNTSWEIPK